MTKILDFTIVGFCGNTEEERKEGEEEKSVHVDRIVKWRGVF